VNGAANATSGVSALRASIPCRKQCGVRLRRTRYLSLARSVNAAFGQIRQPAAEPQQCQRQQRQAGKWGEACPTSSRSVAVVVQIASAWVRQAIVNSPKKYQITTHGILKFQFVADRFILKSMDGVSPILDEFYKLVAIGAQKARLPPQKAGGA
jgi:hypothetical protein